MSLALSPARRERWSAGRFRAFQEGRPDHERWELIDGVPVMMTPPSISHAIIAGNLVALLNRVLGGDGRFLALQRTGVELGIPPDSMRAMNLKGEYRPEPDVVVIDNDALTGRFATRAYLLAEIVSSTDHEAVGEAAEA